MADHRQFLGRYRAEDTVRRLDLSLFVVSSACLLLFYVNLGPLATASQIQPYAALLAWMWVAVRALTLGLHVSAAQGALLLFATYFMVYTYEGDGFDFSDYLRRSGAYLLSAGIFLALQYLNPPTLWRALKFTLPVWFGIGLLRYVDSTTYYSIVTPLVPTVVDSQERGTSSLAPEATDFGLTMVFLLVLCMITRRCLETSGLRAERWPVAVAVASALLSFSGTGYLGLAVVGTIYVLTGPTTRYGQFGRSLLTVVIVVGSITILSLLPVQRVRGVELFRLAVNDPVALMGTTTAYRVVHTIVGLFGIPDSGFLGYGAGSFKSEAPGIYNRHDLGSAFGLEGHYAINVPASLTNTPSSQVAIILVEFGLVGMLYLATIIIIAARSRIPFKGIAIAVLCLAWLGSFPASWPPFWVVIGIMMSPYFAMRQVPGNKFTHSLDEASPSPLGNSANLIAPRSRPSRGRSHVRHVGEDDR